MSAVLIEPHPTASTSTRRWLSLAISLVAVIVVVVGVVATLWYRDSNLLLPYPSHGASAQVNVGQTLYEDMGLYPHLTTDRDGNDTTPLATLVTFTSMTPHLVKNTSDATVEMVVCQRNGSNTGIGDSYRAGLADSCSSVMPFTSPMTVNLGFMTAQVLVAVTPRQPGVVRIAGFDVTYSPGLRHNTQRVGGELVFRTKQGER